MLTYEPSFYATLMAPLVCYAFARLYYKQTAKSLVVFCSALLPLLLSSSLSGLALSALAIGMAILIDWRRALNKDVIIFIVVGIVAFSVYIVTHTTILMERVYNVFAGDDPSANARTFQSFQLALEIAREKSLLWGTGFGQLKIVGRNLISHYWSGDRLPSAFAETLAQFGLLGIGFRFFVEIYLFVKTGVMRNFIRIALFAYVFFLQFGGSYLTNPAEYLLWIMAFSPIFKEFNFTKQHINLNVKSYD
jgi:O-antigen ligase